MKSLERKLEEQRGSDKKLEELESKVKILQSSIGRNGGREISEEESERLLEEDQGTVIDYVIGDVEIRNRIV